MIKQYLIPVMLLCHFSFFSQEYFPKNDGVKTENTNYTAFTNAKIFVTPSQIIENGTLLIKDGKVVATGASVTIPKNAVVYNVTGKSIYPSFIDVYSDFGVDKPKRAERSNGPQYDASREGYYWNDHIKPEQNAIQYFKFDAKSASELREAGFGVVNTHLADGIIRGIGCLIALSTNTSDAERILDDRSGQYSSTERSIATNQLYPTSLMGRIALLKQVNYDADWYAKGHSKVTDRSLEAFNNNKSLIQFIDVGNKLNALRFDKVGDEFNTQYVIIGGGDEYEMVKDIKATNAMFVIPINFPEAYDMEDPFLSQAVGLSELREWNQRPSNPKVLHENGVPFALTTHDLKSPKEFKGQILKAIEYGFNKTAALEALTTIPAKTIGKESSLGKLQPGYYANFLITSGDIFDEKTTLFENWVIGDRHEISPMDAIDIRGNYDFNIAGQKYSVTIAGELDKLKSTVKTDTKELGSKVMMNDDWITLMFTGTDSIKLDYTRLTSKIHSADSFSGVAILPNGNETSFYATKIKKDTASEEEKKDDKKDKESPKIYPITYPNEAFGYTELPKPETLLFKNATVWTNESDGILKNTDVLIQDGKILKIGSNLSAGNAVVIDATGKHLTSGIIDEHTHIAASGSINEMGHNSTAEVTIENVVDSEDINIYRNLAGGVTSAQILHGSANPIGGRSAIIKLKWGEAPDKLIYSNSPKFIKFALGENVKQSNWSNAGSRFPQTRMGVEQVFTDYFTQAQAYITTKKSGKPYRKDLEMEVLAEILNKESFVSCHSYVQSEINMLMKVAEKFDFNINTFTHILEGYKVADKMKAHGVGGSTFSDWWAYKFEVNDAIPQNAAIMHSQGVVTAINSDDAEMSRRLNQEAAKSVKYGGVSEEDAWKFVTLNPAKLLHIDNRVGSIKVGKDADIVLWSDNPLSIYAKAEKTIIDGTVYFDIERDERMRASMKREKNELTTMMLQAKNKGLKTRPIEKKEKEIAHCESIN